MTESQQTPSEESQKPKTVEEKLDTIAGIVVANHQMLTALVDAVNSALQQEPVPQSPTQAPPIPYQPGYPPPVNEYQNVYGEEREYSSADEHHRGPRTYTDLPQQEEAQPLHHPPPIPPGGMPAPPAASVPAAGPSGERVMTPEEYRDAHPE
jgi:hypothetical protein